MNERPILFSGAMVRALLDGSKTQTRRIVKLPHQNPLGEWGPTTIGGPNGGRTREGLTIPEHGAIWHTRTGDVISYSSLPGARLWVRETCRAEELESGLDGVRYLADQEFRPIENTREASEQWLVMNTYRGQRGASVPAIHMPRWASRITLEVTGVRVERLQDISDEDAHADGVRELHLQAAERGAWWTADPSAGAALHGRTPSAGYRLLWEQINGAGSWDANPWVWVIEFRRIDQIRNVA